MSTDTPETDANSERDVCGIDSCDASFARKLERQRNKAIDECIALRQMVRELRDAVTIGIKSQNKGDIWSVQPSKFAKFKEDAVAALTKANQLLP